MKSFAQYFVCLFLGAAIGWSFGYTRPVARDKAEVLNQYRRTKDAFRLTDAEMIEYGNKVPKYLAAVRRSDELAATLSLEAFEQIERGDTEKAKQFLVSKIGYYYAAHRTNDGYTNLITRIERTALKCPAVAAEIYK
jgi:hypothetical protein